MALFDMLELRITEILAEGPAEIEPQAANENELLAAAQTQATLVAVHAALVTEQAPSGADARELRAEVPANPVLPVIVAGTESRPEPEAPAAAAPEARRRGSEPEQPPVQAVVMPALSEPESFPEEIFAPRPEPAPAPQQQDIVALINALTQAEKVALFS
jgi:hypothetical protein